MSRTRTVVSFSGGKDSVATWLYLERELGLDVTCLFADTGWESPVTHDYIAHLVSEHRLQVVRVQGTMRQLRADLPDEPLTMEALAKHKGRFPSAMARFCTTELKLKPMKAWLDLSRAAEPETVFRLASGVRAQESAKRAASDPALLPDDFMGVDRFLPIHGWSVEDVFEIHRRHRVPPNPLYTDGFSRVGCFPCIMSSKSDLRAMAERHPDGFEKLAAMEASVGGLAARGQAAFFSPDKAPLRFSSTRDRGGHPLLFADDIRRWATNDLPALNLFAGAGLPMVEIEDEGDDAAAPACSSVYGLCE